MKLRVLTLFLLMIAVSAGTVNANAATERVKTDWGYISVKEVRAPKGGKCVRVPVIYDIRNPDVAPYILSTVIGDEFSNIIGYQEFSTEPNDDFVKRPAGKYRTTMKVCRSEHVWSTNPSDPTNPFAARVQVKGFKRSTDYDVGWCDGTAYASTYNEGTCRYFADFDFKKPKKG